GEPLRHTARICGNALVSSLPEPETLEQHADPLTPLGHAIETAVQLEVLERGQLPVDERLVAEVANLSARRTALDRPLGRLREAGADPQQRRLPGAVRAGDDEEAAARQREAEPTQDALLAVPLTEPTGREHAARIGRRRDLPPFYASFAQTRTRVVPYSEGNEIDHPRPGGEP